MLLVHQPGDGVLQGRTSVGSICSIDALSWLRPRVSQSRLRRFVDIIHPDISVVVGNRALGYALGGNFAVPAVVVFDGQGREVFKLGGGLGEVGRYFITKRRLTGIVNGLS
ncbi:MAG: hypothetical protein CL566_08670 [Alphaproteobacteria bacterium]|nr:hypothetical protein [Alphaproteobacteria bacterium]|tara:strand:+ start:146 stop:478 length:333 start_codon:yes stop_codon:yes gene_type:complete